MKQLIPTTTLARWFKLSIENPIVKIDNNDPLELHLGSGQFPTYQAPFSIGPLAIVVGSIWHGPTLRLYRQPRWYGLLLPLIGLLYAMMTIDSARQYYLGHGGAWKGRVYQ
jgi:hypothetical protein